MNYKVILMATACLCATAVCAQNKAFIYSPTPSAGLHIAVEEDSTWKDLGQLCASDYGTWGAEKKMYHPSLCRANDGTWRLVFQVNDRAPVLAAAYSQDLVTWRPQDYPRVSSATCTQPVVSQLDRTFNVFYKTKEGQIRRMSASFDFRRFQKDISMPFADQKMWNRKTIEVNGETVEGQLFTLNDDEMAKIRAHFSTRAEDWRISGERMHDDDEKLQLPPMVEATLTVLPDSEKVISDKLIGIFFEDISYAADGGLYAELIQNRDFEYTAKDHGGWTATTAWHSAREIEIATEHPLHPNNPHYALLWNDTLWNEGWDGIVVETGKKYDFSMYVLAGGQRQNFDIQLIGQDGTVLAQSLLKTRARDWQQYTAVLTATASDTKARSSRRRPSRTARMACARIWHRSSPT